MIVGIINGYYRSGTTFMQRLCSKSNPNFIVLSEPTQHEIIDHIMADGCHKDNLLHGWEIFKDYCKLPRKVKHEFIRRHFLHLFLEKLKDWYGCWVLHLDRSVENIIADHFSYYSLVNSTQAKDILLSKDKPISFYADLVFENLTKYLRLDRNIARNNLDKLVFNILATRKIVERQKGITVLNFDEFVRNPKQHLNKLPFKVNESLLRLINPSKKNPVPDWLIDMIKDSVNYISKYIR